MHPLCSRLAVYSVVWHRLHIAERPCAAHVQHEVHFAQQVVQAIGGRAADDVLCLHFGFCTLQGQAGMDLFYVCVLWGFGCIHVLSGANHA